MSEPPDPGTVHVAEGLPQVCRTRPPLAGPEPAELHTAAPVLDPGDASAGGGRRAFSERYQFLEVLGEGGVSIVALALDKAVGRKVALKELKPAFADHPAIRRRFAREIEVNIYLEALEHPGILPVYDRGDHSDGRPWFTSRVVRGETLGETVRREGITRTGLARLVAAVREACLLADVAHRAGVLHRDLKPANIMISRTGAVYLIDWGLAGEDDLSVPCDPDAPRPASLGGGLTEPGVAIGTAAYASPEQWLGGGGGVAGDVFSLGGILYFVLTGRPPFPQDRRRGDPGAAAPPPRAINPDAPPALEAACLQAIRADPTARPSSAAELADALRRWLDAERGA